MYFMRSPGESSNKVSIRFSHVKSLVLRSSHDRGKVSSELKCLIIAKRIRETLLDALCQPLHSQPQPIRTEPEVTTRALLICSYGVIGVETYHSALISNNMKHSQSWHMHTATS
jgi:hypothetical protein